MRIITILIHLHAIYSSFIARLIFHSIIWNIKLPNALWSMTLAIRLIHTIKIKQTLTFYYIFQKYLLALDSALFWDEFVLICRLAAHQHCGWCQLILQRISHDMYRPSIFHLHWNRGDKKFTVFDSIHLPMSIVYRETPHFFCIKNLINFAVGFCHVKNVWQLLIAKHGSDSFNLPCDETALDRAKSILFAAMITGRVRIKSKSCNVINTCSIRVNEALSTHE